MYWMEVLLDGLLLTAITLGASLWGSPFFQDLVSKKRGAESAKRPGAVNSLSDENQNHTFTILVYGICILFTIGRVFLAYEGQENSDYFFWHPYLAWLIADMMWILVKRGSLGKKGLLQRVFLWPFLVIPVFSGMSLSVGWLMKLYLRYILPYKF